MFRESFWCVHVVPSVLVMEPRSEDMKITRGTGVSQRNGMNL